MVSSKGDNHEGFKEMEATDFEEHSWCCEDFWEKIHEQNLEAQLNFYMEDVCSDGVEWTKLNDIFRFDGDMILKDLGYVEDEEEDDE